MEQPFPVERWGSSQYDTRDELSPDGELLQRVLVLDAVLHVPLPLRGPNGQTPMIQVVARRLEVPFGNRAWERLAQQLLTGTPPDPVPDVMLAPAAALGQLDKLRGHLPPKGGGRG